MVESLVITLREGIEAALVIGIILAYLRKTGKMTLGRFVYVGLAFAVLASLGFAILFKMLNISPDNQLWEGTMLGIAGVFVATMVIWMWRTARNIKGGMESRLASIVADGQESGHDLRQGLGLAAFTFFMVLREGIEMILFLAAATLAEFNALSTLGALLGIGLATIFAIFFVRGSLRINLSRFFNVTGLVLLVMAAKLIAGSIHEFEEIGLIPMSPGLASIFDYIAKDTTSTIILIALLALPMFLILWDTGKKDQTEPVRNLSLAEQQKLLAGRRRDIVWRISLTAATFAVISAMATSVIIGG